MPSFSLKLIATLVALAAPLFAAAAVPPSCPPVPERMRAARIAAPGGPEALRIESIGLPRPGPGEVLVRVH